MAKQTNKKTCFVIGPIGEPESDIRDWSDKILECIVTPAVKACGYKQPVRADKIAQSGLITIQIMQHLVRDDLVVADLTGPNANVYYELAVRHAARKPFVQLIKTGERIPFDLKDLRTIEVSTDIKIGQEATEQLKTYIPEIEKRGQKVITPISLVVELELMRTSGDQQQRTLADLLEKMDILRSSIFEVGEDILNQIQRVQGRYPQLTVSAEILQEARKEAIRRLKQRETKTSEDDNL